MRSWLITATFVTSVLSQFVSLPDIELDPQVAQAQVAGFCWSSSQAIAQKEALLKTAVRGDQTAKNRYQELIAQDAQRLRQCRAQSWPQIQAIWLRLYPCDFKPGVLDSLMDRIANRGYNRIYLEVFYNGQVLLPAANNPTTWPTVVRNSEYAQSDLLAQAIQKGHERGLGVYAWMFSLNYGYIYGQRPDRQQVLARNGQGQTSLTIVDTRSFDVDLSNGDVDKVFIDPYNFQARQDYNQLLRAVLQRRPDGVLFDYIRYPRQSGAASIASKVKDLWIYSDASQQALVSRALNNKGQVLIQRYLRQGYISANDLATVDKLYPTEREPLWQGRNPPSSPLNKPLPPIAWRLPLLQQDLWLLSAAHAYQGVVDFLAAAALPVQQQNIAAGAVFFPDGNRRIGQGFDSRMQAWDRFPSSIEWHPMSYGSCGGTSCVVDQVRRVVDQAPPGTRVSPVIAGAWGQAHGIHLPLEAQMYAIRQAAPQINSISHFDYSWQDPQFANARRACSVSY